MKIGMSWFNNDPAMPEPARIAEAADYYARKYGSVPNRVYIHPRQGIPEGDLSVIVGGQAVVILVKHSISIMPNHYWIGLDGDKKDGSNG